MAMLAEPKCKQKWSEDPRNTAWSKDKERYGYQMLEKMGWADGRGLGKEQRGNVSHVKIKKRKGNVGLGAKESTANDWIGQQQDFSNLLSALQQQNGNTEVHVQGEEQNNQAMLEVAKASRKRVFYKKFIRNKDTSQYSQKDMACIFGNQPSQSAPVTPLNQSDEETESEDSTTSCPAIPCDPSSGIVTYNSKQNIQEYFARRMKALRDDKGQDRIEKDERGDEMNLDEEVEAMNDEMKRGNAEDVQVKSRKKKKRKRETIEVGQNEATVDKKEHLPESLEKNLDTEIEKSSKITNIKKNKKKAKRSKMEDVVDSKIAECDIDLVSGENENQCCSKESLTYVGVKSKRNKRMKKDDRLEDVDERIASVSGGNDKIVSGGMREKVKRKKSKKDKRDVSETDL